LIQRVLIIGGYGNFGSFIARSLASDAYLRVIIAGRSLKKAQAFVQKLTAVNGVEAYEIDIQNNISIALNKIKPNIVVHTSGPFQNQGYAVAQICIDAGIHYIDLADGRDFVANIKQLDAQAKKKGVLVVSGASSVPCLTAALVDHYQTEFKSLDCLDYGITTAQKTARGLATTAAILGYTGKGFSTIQKGKLLQIFGWQGLKARKYNQLGWRLLGNCDIPDLALFPDRYPSIKTIRFYAGLEVPFIHITLWGISWLVRAGVLQHLENYAAFMLRLSFMFDWLGSSDSALHMELSGKDFQNLDKKINFELTASSGDGPYIPCMPAILLTRKLAKQEITKQGAFPCVGFITLDEYLNSLKDLHISWQETISYH
jgi:saccharopine dehydrogenase-like NADP-dependent oxidoreductase